tara:strand:+ start:1830 stop:2495 length:666 start_codon:yes stop_codon:yes gene_type:complete
MKKAGALSILLILSISLIAAQDFAGIEQGLEDLEEKGEQAEELVDTITDEEARAQYLKKEWTKILEKTKAGKIILSISDFLAKFNPLFKIVLGVEYSLSWAFIFSVLIWLILFGLIFLPASSIFDNKLTGLITTIVITSLIGIGGVIKKAIDFLSLMINNIWIALVSLLIALAVAFLIGKMMKQSIKEEKEESKKEKTTRHRKIIKTEAKVAEEELKSRSK